MNARGKTVFIAFLSLFFTGCMYVPIQYGEDDRIVRDPSYLRVVYINTTGYYLDLEGELSGGLGPNESATRSLGCPGEHRVVAHAYKEVGRSSNGRYIEKVFVGDQDISFYVNPTDSFNYNGQIVSRIVYFGSFYLNPQYPYKNIRIPVYTPCSIFLPNITIEKR